MIYFAHRFSKKKLLHLLSNSAVIVEDANSMVYSDTYFLCQKVLRSVMFVGLFAGSFVGRLLLLC